MPDLLMLRGREVVRRVETQYGLALVLTNADAWVIDDQARRLIQDECAGGDELASREELVAMLTGAVAILSAIDSPRGAAYRKPLVARIMEALSHEPSLLPVIDVAELTQ